MYQFVLSALIFGRNGGAGATGLIRALAEDYLSTFPKPQGSITWVCNHSRNTQLALLHNYIDIALTYERTTELIAGSEGWSEIFGCVFHDHFVLAGPASDPAGVMSCKSLGDGMRRIAQLGRGGTEGIFWYARNDDSATMWKERSLWGMIGDGLEPWEDTKACESWYQMSVYTPAEAIQKADVAGAYSLTDRATLLKQAALRTIERTTVYFEPSAADDVLMNSCFALHSPNKGGMRNEHVQGFLEYVLSGRGQEVVRAFGEDSVGEPFFATVEESFVRRRLRGGGPRKQRWAVDDGL